MQSCIFSLLNKTRILLYTMIVPKLFDRYLTFNHKVIISLISGGIWIYFRTSDCYKMIPRLHIFPVFFVVGWIYLNYYEPLFLPIGLCMLVLYSYLGKKLG